MCTVLLYISVKGDSTLKSNYTTITSSLIKQRATRLIQPCDPAERAHSSHQYCNDALLIGDVAMSAAQCHSSRLAFDFNHMSHLPITL